MTQPSKAAAAFLAFFGLPFLGAGLFFIYAQLAGNGNLVNGNRIFGVMFGSVFALSGGGLIYAAIGGYGRLKKQAGIEESNPLSPWLWRTDWASRRAKSLNQRTEITYWVICIFCNMILLPVVGGLAPKMVRSGDPRAFLLLGFGSIGVILLANAVRATIRHRRFGNTYFEFNALPFSPGDRVGGRIHFKLETQAQHGIDLRLSCVRRVVTGSGDSSTTREAILWQAEQNVPSGAVGPGPLGRMIPVDFTLPRRVTLPITIIRMTRFSGCSTRKPTFPAWTTPTISNCPSSGVRHRLRRRALRNCKLLPGRWLPAFPRRPPSRIPAPWRSRRERKSSSRCIRAALTFIFRRFAIRAAPLGFLYSL